MANLRGPEPGPTPGENPKRRGPVSRIFLHNTGFWVFVLSYPLLASVLYFVVQGRPVRVGTRSALTPALPLYQTEVSALISLLEVAIAFVYMPWCAVASWRIIYLLLATRGTRLPELSRIAGGGLPWLRSFRGEYRGLSYLLVLTTAASFLSQHLPKPLLAASIAWTPITLQSQTESSVSLPVAGESTQWDKFNVFEEERRNLVLKSAGMAFLGSPSSSNSTAAATPRRFFSPTESIPVNSTLHGLPVPFLMVDKLEWVLNPAATLNPTTLLSAITEDGMGVLNISSPAGVMTRTVIGNTAILKTTPWTPAPIKFASKPLNRYAFPSPAPFRQERYVAVLVERVEDLKDDKCPKTSRYFGKLPPLDLYPMQWFLNGDLYALNCYAIAKATIRAGSFRCTNCTAVSRRAAETILLPDSPELAQDTSDALILPILDVLPEVMLNIAIINGTGAQFWNNLDGYTRGMMMAAYQAAWNAMTDTFQGPDPATAQVFPPEYLITLLIDMRWFLPWLVVTFTGILCGSVFVVVSVAYKGEVVSAVRDPAFAAILLDLRKVYGRLRGLNRSGKPGKQEKKITFAFSGDGVGGGRLSDTRRVVVKGGTLVDVEEPVLDDSGADDAMLMGNLGPSLERDD